MSNDLLNLIKISEIDKKASAKEPEIAAMINSRTESSLKSSLSKSAKSKFVSVCGIIKSPFYKIKMRNYSRIWLLREVYFVAFGLVFGIFGIETRVYELLKNYRISAMIVQIQIVKTTALT